METTTPVTHHASKATTRKNRAQRLLIKELFPALFQGNHPLPMKNGIKDDMLTQIVRRGLDISEEKLQQSLRACCCSQVYQMRIINGRARYDIDGKPVEEISKEDKKHARRRVNKYRKEYGLKPLKSALRGRRHTPSHSKEATAAVSERGLVK
ncbi:Conjugal transfer repressor [Citrobacter werkmanii]|uniref:Conjugal transfer repressor n=1 Tax=Citrobacter werkmanii TaxID=67827 RepID=A0A9N8CWL3_9ENTR|nr:ProQ/FINO family protein [Citrobacter werkmanii]CAB5550059.1 Conjugal transfer repressor [Citrobacter werkmanii]CAB5578155.1 Conjugal transfer repressor [Citrobacter werkmanii]CAB5591463.1 Conjugal transfer repressor [Citrobacter werkmanii]CAB5591757.1 Conjugal transfer repressor [Citrobacter werkmanii]CAB5591845.1 Conjugal transfer repressor [Citrobacter werkmanii]